MAYFRKYNGYTVRDAEAIKHVNISGNRITTTNSDGNTVDTFLLPGGFTSATYMSYLDDKFVKSFQNTISGTIFDSSNIYTDGSNHGLVLSDDVVGYADITFGNNFYTLSDLHIQTVRSWQTFSKTGNDPYNQVQAYRNDYLRQIRPNKYKALISVGKYNNSITVNSGSSVEVARFTPILTVKDPSGHTIGSAIVIGVRPHLEYNSVNTGVDFYLSQNGVTAYNGTSASKTVKSVVVEVEIALSNIEVENFFESAPNVPFIESANGYRYVEDSTTYDSYAEITVVVKNRGSAAGYYLDEYKLTYTAGTDSWSWVRTTSKAIPDNLTSGTYYNKEYTFKHYTMNSDTFEQQSATSAVAYMVGLGQGSSAAFSRSDAIPIAGLLYWM